MALPAAEPDHPEVPVVLGRSIERSEHRMLAPSDLLQRIIEEPQKAVPAIVKDPAACAQIENVVRGLETRHLLYNTDSRQLVVDEESVELVVTSPPYWTLKKYNDHGGQLGDIADYEQFLDELDHVWRRAYRALVPGGRLVIVVGDVNVSRHAFGRHLVFPLHASIQESAATSASTTWRP